jgi:queuine tRNA-ribosyltransferase
MFKFIVEHEDKKTRARAGRIVTPHGEIETPVFMPVGTVGSVKTQCTQDLVPLGAQFILGNTYHLFVRPGTDLIKKAGGLHKFMAWPGAVLTDSGGYQVFSMQEKRKVTDEGVLFQSHVDGDRLHFTPESVVQAQKDLGADIIMAFDECPPFPCPKDHAAQAMQRTHQWLERCVAAHRANPADQALFGIIQGGVYDDLRAESAAFVLKAMVDGIAIGGVSVGEPMEEMYRIANLVARQVPRQKPLYLMGIGLPENIVETAAMGVDMFDCVLPTRNARNGQVFTSQGKLAYKAGEHREALDRPLDPGCACFVCKNYSLGYLRHLFNCGELTALRLASYHNLYFYLNMMRDMRNAILRDEFSEWKARFIGGLARNGRETADRSDHA